MVNTHLYTHTQTQILLSPSLSFSFLTIYFHGTFTLILHPKSRTSSSVSSNPTYLVTYCKGTRYLCPQYKSGDSDLKWTT